jgi:WD40 repeat protein
MTAGLTDADFSADDRLLLTGSTDGAAQLWDVTAADAPGKSSPPRMLFSLSGHVGAVSCVQISPDSKHAATGGVDGNAIEWDTATGKLEQVHEPPPDDATKTYSYEDHPQAITAERYSPDSLFLATGSSDGYVRVWDVQSGLLLLTQQVFQKDTVKDLNWSADGHSLLAANTGEVRLLDVSRESLPPDRVAEAVDRRSRYILSDKGLEPRAQSRPVVLKSN